MPGIGRDLLVGDPAAVEAERDPGGQVDAGDGFGGEILGGEEDQVAWLPLPPRVNAREQAGDRAGARWPRPFCSEYFVLPLPACPAEAPAAG